MKTLIEATPIKRKTNIHKYRITAQTNFFEKETYF